MNAFLGSEWQEAVSKAFSSVKTLVAKTGTSVLVQDGNGHLDKDKVYQICNDAIGIIDRGIDFYFVSSGASFLGMIEEGITDRKAFRDKFSGNEDRYYSYIQHFENVGQSKLVELYRECFAECSNGRIGVAQFLIARDDIKKFDKTLKNFYGIDHEVHDDLGLKVTVPIINDNGGKSYKYLKYKYRDNDTLSSQVHNFVDADALFILSGNTMFDKNPEAHPDAEKVDFVYSDRIGGKLLQNTNGMGVYGRGGMKPKCMAMKGKLGSIIDYKHCDYGDMRMQRTLDGDYFGTTFMPSGMLRKYIK